MKTAPRAIGAPKFLGAALELLFAVVFGVMLGGLVGRMRRVKAVGVRKVCVMAGLVVIAFFVVLGSLAMMMRGLGVMVGGAFVMVVGLAAHDSLPGEWS